jgi:choline dehydrogenase
LYILAGRTQLRKVVADVDDATRIHPPPVAAVHLPARRVTARADVLVLGGGTAGAVLAARLSEDASRSVVVVEGGPHYGSRDTTPPDLLDGSYMTPTKHDWGFTARIRAGVEMPYLRGKAMGGSSAINGAIALRGAPEDFDLWASLGNDLWSWAAMLPSFCRLEHDQDFGTAGYHGASGPLPIRRWVPEELSTFAGLFQQALLAAGHPDNPDHNAPRATGVGVLPMNTDGGVRVSTSLSYLGGAQHRPNLTILAGHTATRLVLAGTRVVGAMLTGPDGPVEVRAGEVIVSAGAVQSPQLLLRSGIGAAATLEGLGIACAVDLPGVGRNLLEHPTALVMMIARDTSRSDQRGPLVQVASRFTAPGSDTVNDLQMFGLNNLSIAGFPQLREHLRVDTVNGIGSSVQFASSAGAVTIDQDGAPVIDFNVYSAEADLKRAMAGLRAAWQVANDSAIAEHWQIVTPLTWAQVEDDDELSGFLRAAATPHYHASGSCHMGPETDPEAVVDQYLRVRGVDGLRIVDASIMPTITRANTNLSTIAIAERAVELIDG